MSAAEKYEGAGGPEVYDEGPLYASAGKVYPQKVNGTYRRMKWALLSSASGVYYLLPFVRWDRGPNEPNQAVLVDLAHRGSISSASSSGRRRSITSPAC